MEPFKVNTKTEIPVGSYSAKVGGYVSEFYVGAIPYRAEFAKGVKGFDIPDVVSVLTTGELYSNKLGVYAIGLKRCVWTDV